MRPAWAPGHLTYSGRVPDPRVSPLAGRRPRRDELTQFVDGTVDDIVCPQPKLVVVGINPGLWTAAVNAPFAHPGNRFWPSLHRSGLLPRLVDASAGLSAEDEKMVIERGIGLTNLVNRATAKAAELTDDELRSGQAHVRHWAERFRPGVVAIIGITAYRTAFGDKRAQLGRQPDSLGDSQLWVLPQPSGLNAHAPLPVLVDWWQQVGRASGLLD